MNNEYLPHLSGDIYIPESVYKEIRSQLAKNIFELLNSKYKISIIQPEQKFIEIINNIIHKLGQNNLSSPDIDILALAIYLKQFDDVTIITDDYAIRNIAHELDIKSRGVKTTGGNKKRKYFYRCTACGTVFQYKIDNCDVCGHNKFNRFYK